MIALVYLLFIRSKSTGVFSLFKPDSVQKIIALLLFLFLPVLNFFGRWDNYLSSALYSGNVPVLRIQVNDQDEALLPSSIRQAVDIRIAARPPWLWKGESWMSLGCRHTLKCGAWKN